MFKEHGALTVVECWGDDVPEGTLTSFPIAVKRQDDETMVFSWITWASRAARDEGMKRVMADARLQPATHPMPFDGKRCQRRFDPDLLRRVVVEVHRTHLGTLVRVVRVGDGEPMSETSGIHCQSSLQGATIRFQFDKD